MNIKGFFSNIGKSIVSGATSIFSMILEAKPENILKAGLFVGTVIVTAVVAFRTLKQKHTMMTNDSNMSPVDRALALNYTDKRNIEKLSPILEEVKKTLSNKNTKKNKFNDTKIKNTLKYLKNRNTNKYNPAIMSELEKFEKEMREIELNNDNDIYHEYNFALRDIWERA
jgi:hypothetical protein